MKSETLVLLKMMKQLKTYFSVYFMINSRENETKQKKNMMIGIVRRLF
jgi:hypothetical protein